MKKLVPLLSLGLVFTLSAAMPAEADRQDRRKLRKLLSKSHRNFPGSLRFLYHLGQQDMDLDSGDVRYARFMASLRLSRLQGMGNVSGTSRKPLSPPHDFLKGVERLRVQDGQVEITYAKDGVTELDGLHVASGKTVRYLAKGGRLQNLEGISRRDRGSSTYYPVETAFLPKRQKYRLRNFTTSDPRLLLEAIRERKGFVVGKSKGFETSYLVAMPYGSKRPPRGIARETYFGSVQVEGPSGRIKEHSLDDLARWAQDRNDLGAAQTSPIHDPVRFFLGKQAFELELPRSEFARLWPGTYGSTKLTHGEWVRPLSNATAPEGKRWVIRAGQADPVLVPLAALYKPTPSKAGAEPEQHQVAQPAHRGLTNALRAGPR